MVVRESVLPASSVNVRVEVTATRTDDDEGTTEWEVVAPPPDLLPTLSVAVRSRLAARLSFRQATTMSLQHFKVVSKVPLEQEWTLEVAIFSVKRRL